MPGTSRRVIDLKQASFAPLYFEPPPVYFMHLPRTGGTALGRWLHLLYGRHGYVDLKAVELPGMTAATLGRFSCYHSWHMGHGMFERLARPDLACITLLRQPVERAVSDLLGTQRMAIHHSHRFTAAGLADFQPWLHASVEECIRGRATDDLLANTQCRILGSSRTYAELFNLPAGALRPPLSHVSWFDFPWIEKSGESADADTVGRAHAWLDKMAVVGLTERYAESVQLIADFLGVAVPATLPRANLNPQRSSPTAQYRSKLAPETTARLEELNRHDLDLYAHATELFEQQWARHQAKPRRTYSVAPRLRLTKSKLKGWLRRTWPGLVERVRHVRAIYRGQRK